MPTRELATPVYLVHVPDRAERFAVVAEAFEAFEADAGLWFVASDIGLSPLYHDIKRRLRPAGPFAVAPLQGVPKFKRMQPGALKWIRERSRRD